MTRALDVFGPKLPGPIVKANWLGRYLAVEKRFDAKLFDTMKEAEKGVVSALGIVQQGENISSQVRTLQLRLARKAVRDVVEDLFSNKFTTLLKGYQSDAAEAAIDASLYDQRGLLAKLFPNPTDRQNYADSLRQTARRNVESVITRVLFTEQPLSQRVWNTKALSNGYIDTAINNGLARGDSAADIAKSVRSLVRPDTPGGVSYAAKRLGRTEINNAFHAQSIADAQEKPWVTQMEWNLSKRHEADPGDLCEDYALMGQFDKERVPDKPHPNCRCFVVPVLLDYDAFETGLIQGHYDSYIDRVMHGETYSVGGPAATKAMSPKEKAAAAKRRKAYIESAKKAKVERESPKKAKVERESPSKLIDWDIEDDAASVGRKLKDKYPQLEIEGFDYYKAGEKGTAREIGRAIDEMMTKYPNSELKGVRIFPTWGTDNIGEADPVKRVITMNQSFFTGRRYLYSSDPNRFHPPGFEERPFYCSTIHEFGHILDYKGNMRARNKVHGVSNNQFFSDPTVDLSMERRPEVLNKWLKDNAPSGYAMHEFEGKFNRLNPGEALPEAFQDVEVNKDKARPMSIALWEILLRSAGVRKRVM